jgi:hypothetical protein
VSDNLRDRIAEIIQTHSVCACGEWAENFEEHCAHIADALIAEFAIRPIHPPQSPPPSGPSCPACKHPVAGHIYVQQWNAIACSHPMGWEVCGCNQEGEE